MNLVNLNMQMVQATPQEWSAILMMLGREGAPAPLGALTILGPESFVGSGKQPAKNPDAEESSDCQGTADGCLKRRVDGWCHLKNQPCRWVAGSEGLKSPLPHSESWPAYFIRKEFGCWRIRVDGKETVAQDCRGMELVAWLLVNPPDEAIHASVLENHVDGDSMTHGGTAIDFGDGNGIQHSEVAGAIVEIAGNKLKGKMSLPALKQKIAELRIDRDDETLTEAEREQADNELTKLLQHFDRGGKVSGQAEQAAERVRKAIKSLITELKAAKRQQGLANIALRTFGEHLEQHLWLPSMGGKNRAGAAGRPGCFIYEAPTGVCWED